MEGVCRGWRVRARASVFAGWSGEVCAEGGVCGGEPRTWKVCVEALL